jgi:pimeloyl-ACP methyl ester carboxylesterase
MLARIDQLFERYERRVSRIGWSLGGLYARQLAKIVPDKVRCVICLGSPFAGSPKSTNAWRTYEFVSGRKIEDENLPDALAEAPPVPTTSIFSRTDVVCAWQTCLNEDGPKSRTSRSMAATAVSAIIRRPSTPWPTASPSQRAPGRNSTAVDGATYFFRTGGALRRS